MRVRDQSLMTVCTLLLSLILFAGCENRSPFMGRYTGEGSEEGAVPTVVLELKEAGQGSWETEDETVPFRWDSAGDEIRLYTKAGGIVQGRLVGECLWVSLPSAGTVRFLRNGH